MAGSRIPRDVPKWRDGLLRLVDAARYAADDGQPAGATFRSDFRVPLTAKSDRSIPSHHPRILLFDRGVPTTLYWRRW
jgi:hypothetical protein